MKKIFAAAAAVLLATTGLSAAESVPFSHSFEGTDCLDGWSVPAASSFTEFKYCAAGAYPLYAYRDAVRSRNGSNYSNAAWLITPALNLQGGQSYKVTYTIAVSQGQNENITISYGSQPTGEALTQAIVPTDGYFGKGFGSPDNNIIIEGTFTPATSGEYYVGLFDNTEANQGLYSAVYSFSITAQAAGAVPGDPTDFFADPNSNGNPVVKLTATAPTTDASGAALTSLTEMRFLCDGTVINTVNNPQKGQSYTYTYENAPEGYHTFGVQAVNANGEGNVVEKRVFVGAGKPRPVEGLTVKDLGNSKLELNWTAPTHDAEGNPIAAGAVSYEISTLKGENVVATETVKGVTTATVTVADIPAGDQEFVKFEVAAVTAGGKSEAVSSLSVPVGTPYTIPYTETFAGKKTTHAYIYEKGRYSGSWDFFEIEGQSAMRFWGSGAGADATMYSANIAIPAGEKTVMAFKYSGYTNNSVSTVELLINDGTGEFKSAGSYVTSTADWQTATVDLSAYAGKTIQFAIRATLGYASGQYVMVTDINIAAPAARDLGFSAIDFPAEIVKCDPATATMTVINLGSETINSFTVELYANETRVATKPGSEIAPGAEQEITFDLVTDTESTAQITYYGVVSVANDANPANNTSARAIVKVVTPELKPVTGLAVEMLEDDTVVKLLWNAPEGVSADAANPYFKLLGYRLFRNDFPVTTDLITETTYTEANLEPGQYSFRVIAVYEAGDSESTPNLTATVKEKPEIPDSIETITAANAPADALFFDLQGRAVKATALTNGIYIMKTAAEVRRVLVK